jgi:hypothetical protein
LNCLKTIGKILSGIACCFAIHSVNAQHSVLSEGNWFKLSITKNGVYKINFDLLKKMGIDPGKVNPQKIKIFGNGGGMVPQANSIPRIADLAENAIYVEGEADGIFNKEDFILFYAQGPDRSYFKKNDDIFFYEKNLYSDKNYYFLTIASTDGKRLATNNNSGTGFPVVNEFDDYTYHELDTYNELQSGREWFGENFQINPVQSFRFDAAGIVSNSIIKLVSDVVARSKNNASFNLFLNSALIASQQIALVPETQYGIKGRHQHDTLMVDASFVSAPSNITHEIRYEFLETAGGKGYLDYFLVSYKRKLALYDKQIIFTSAASLENLTSTFEVSGLSDKCTMWEITDPLTPKIQSFSLTGDKGIFSAMTVDLREFIVFNNEISLPEFSGKLSSQDLHGLQTPDLVIVTHKDFKEEALRMASHRQSHSGWQVAVVTTEEVFNEFSSGRQDITAIRDFVKFLYDKNPGKLRSLLLFGRSSYDYKDRIPDNTNFVPTYESRSSLHPLETYSSDDFFAFLESDEGSWNEKPAEDHTMDIGVGRFPVKTIEEAHDIVNKIIDYDTNKKNFGRWRKEIVLVADDGDTNIHQSQSDQLGKQIENSNPEFNTRRIFLDAYQQTVTPGGEVAPAVNKAIQDALDRGSIIINYTGHGGEKLWAQEKIFDNLMIDDLDNKNYPLFVTATCEFGRNDDPGIISSAELSVLKKNGGAIGMVTTARPVSSNTNFELNQAFYDALFTRESNSFLPLGEIVRRTKNNSTSGVSNRNFSLLGDPSMKLAFPEYKVSITEIKNQEGTDSVKALSTITVKGEVHDAADLKAEDFQGVIDATLFDKELSFTTLGDENAPYSYKQWSNALFRGKADVINGDFQFQFIVPKNIAYQVGKGKLSLYANNTEKTLDATGAELSFVVGKSYANPLEDVTSPAIQLFMGDTTFISGGTVSPDTYLVARLGDKSGINISGYGIGNNILAIMDQQETFILNDYYEANENDFTKGKISFSMKGLTPGRHSITLKAWDTYNNPAQAAVDFVVSDGNEIQIETFGNYPNPFTDKTTLYFTHNRPGDDLEAFVSIYNIAGEILKTFDFSVSSSNYRVEFMELDQNTLSKKLAPGLYLARLIVRSLSNGSKNEHVTKLIILN